MIIFKSIFDAAETAADLLGASPFQVVCPLEVFALVAECKDDEAPELSSFSGLSLKTCEVHSKHP